jgi:hypothetical protein
VNQDSPASTYWLYQWIDDQGIRKPDDLHKALRRPEAIDRLLELEDSAQSAIYDPRRRSKSVVAGRRVDLSGFLDCSHFECIQPKIDTLFGRTWHYFDIIVVDDTELHRPDDDAGQFLWDVEQRINLLLYLRKIGASDHVAFKRKLSGFCQQHFREFAEENDLGLDVLFDDTLANRVVQELTSAARFEISRHGDHWRYEINHPRLERIIGTYAHSDPAVKPDIDEVARDAFGVYCSGLISDIAATRDLGIPLLQVADGILISEPVGEAVQDDIVALNLRLPVLMNVPVKEILRLKHDNWPEFERFRSALRVAIREQIDKAGTKSPEEIATAVLQEYVNPELADIERHLATTRKGLAKKIGAGVALGGATVTAGALATIPLVVATGVAAIATSLPQVYKYFEDKNEVEMSDLYFLWKARIREKRAVNHRRV